MGAVIWLIIIVAFFINMSNKKAEQEKKASSGHTAQQYGQPQTYVKPGADRQPQAYARPKADRQPQKDVRPTQAELKARLQEKYGKLNSDEESVQSNTPDILAKANKNVSRYTEDEIHETQCASEKEHPLMHAVEQNKPVLKDADPLTVSALNGSELIKNVEELMVTGYPVNLEFERDFLGEAMDMLNSYIS